MGLGVRMVAQRLEELGFNVPETAPLLEASDDEQILLLSKEGNGRTPWLETENPVPMGHLYFLATRTGRSVPESAARLTALGFKVPRLARVSGRPDPDDVTLLSSGRIRGLGQLTPWLDDGREVPPGHLVVASAVSGRSITTVAARLVALGYKLPEPFALPAELSNQDLTLLSRTFASRQSEGWLDFQQPVPLGHIAAGSLGTGLSIHDVATRMRDLGFITPDPSVLPARIDRDEMILLSRDCDGGSPWINLDQPVSFSYLTAAARRGLSIPDVADWLKSHGFSLPNGFVIARFESGAAGGY
jgi:hypothetical protein